MSYNGSGTFQINTSGQPVVTGTVISSSAFNALTADLATGLSTAITKDGQTATTVRIPFAQGINSSLTTDTSSGSTGSIFTAGGVGITKALYVGTNATVVGTLGVTGAATFSTNPVFSALTASSAVATDASKNLVSVTNTGTGNNVLATSPTLVTPVLGAASATSVTVAAGAVGTPSITTTGDTNTGIFFPAADTIAFTEGGAESMRIDSSGNVLIGTGTAGGIGCTITADGNGRYFVNNCNYNGFGVQIFKQNGTQVGSIAINSTTTTYGTTSDYRLKENIEPMTGALSIVSKLKPVKYKWKKDGSDGQGFIAHELQEIISDCVTGTKDAVDADGNPVYQGIDTSFLVATLTAAIQEQQALITSLTARIAALEAK